MLYKLRILFLDILKPRPRHRNKKNGDAQDLNKIAVPQSINNIETQISSPVQEVSDEAVLTDASNNIVMLPSTESVKVLAAQTTQTKLTKTDVEHVPSLISPVPIEPEYSHGKTCINQL